MDNYEIQLEYIGEIAGYEDELVVFTLHNVASYYSNDDDYSFDIE